MPFNPQEWIVVVDSEICTHSKAQVDICNKMDLKIKGAILCNDKEHSNSQPCQQVPAFPSFCNINSQVCISGLRETAEDFEELQQQSDQMLAQKKS